MVEPRAPGRLALAGGGRGRALRGGERARGAGQSPRAAAMGLRLFLALRPYRARAPQPLRSRRLRALPASFRNRPRFRFVRDRRRLSVSAAVNRAVSAPFRHRRRGAGPRILVRAPGGRVRIRRVATATRVRTARRCARRDPHRGDRARAPGLREQHRARANQSRSARHGRARIPPPREAGRLVGGRACDLGEAVRARAPAGGRRGGPRAAGRRRSSDDRCQPGPIGRPRRPAGVRDVRSGEPVSARTVGGLHGNREPVALRHARACLGGRLGSRRWRSRSSRSRPSPAHASAARRTSASRSR